MAVLGVLVSPTAHASLICGLTSEDVADVNNFYELGLDPTDFTPFLTDPFNCSPYGDLCAMVSPPVAEAIVCDMWSDLTAHAAQADVIAHAGAAITSGESEWDSSAGALVGSCPVKKGVVFDLAAVPERKLKVRAYYTNLLLYKEIGGSSKGSFMGAAGGWQKDLNGEVHIDADFTSFSSSGASNCIRSDLSDVQVDGFVNVHKSSFFSNPDNMVTSSGAYNGVWGESVRVCGAHDPVERPVVSVIAAFVLAGCSAGEPVPVPEGRVPVTDTLAASAIEMQSLLMYQVGAYREDPGVSENESSPFSYFIPGAADVPKGVPGWYPLDEVCFRTGTDVLVEGRLDLGEEVPLQVGDDAFTLKRRGNFGRGSGYYDYDPVDDTLQIGQTAGADIVIDGVATGVQLPHRLGPIDDPSFVDEMVKTGILDMTWDVEEATAPRRWVFAEVFLYDAELQGTALACMFEDDGAASVDLGYDMALLKGLEMSTGRLYAGIFEHPEAGPTLAFILRNQGYTRDNLLGTPTTQ